MSEIAQNDPKDRLEVLIAEWQQGLTPQDKEAERRGFIPSPLLRLWEAMEKVMSESLETGLAARTLTPEQVTSRATLARELLLEQMLPPDDAKGPYAIAWHRNFHEALDNVIDIERETPLITDFDRRINAHFDSSFRKADIIMKMLLERLQKRLGQSEEAPLLTEYQINNAFTNISEEQMRALVEIVAESGLSLKEGLPDEKRRELRRGFRDRLDQLLKVKS